MSRGICLVVEDDEDIAGLISLILTQEGFDVHAVGTGMAALREAPGLNPALITLDLGLPDIDGLHIAQDLRKMTAAPLLILTARAAVTDQLDGMSAGASGYLAKPFRPHELRDAINQICPAHS
ncbi:response regulator transcription factor [Arthrobacter sp. ISL-30]|uniref:response regulator transcription factor n=1 Tax=Arthrobacter sp. ISL-30 TaxID=2819109 RepID=UPI001BE6B7F0|nr:response regulator transcription factor [Arthrobacter sp. ISL-30]MBT2512887.1 response regulator transcription factor [Arthrobacter sp. ISL-30]